MKIVLTREKDDVIINHRIILVFWQTSLFLRRDLAEGQEFELSDEPIEDYALEASKLENVTDRVFYNINSVHSYQPVPICEAFLVEKFGKLPEKLYFKPL
jgi:hypothetical protein